MRGYKEIVLKIHKCVMHKVSNNIWPTKKNKSVNLIKIQSIIISKIIALYLQDIIKFIQIIQSDWDNVKKKIQKATPINTKL